MAKTLPPCGVEPLSARTRQEWTRTQRCMQIFFGTMELASLAVGCVLLYWFAQSQHQVVKLHAEPMVTAVTREYVEVHWDAERVLNCPGRVYPAIVTPWATEALPDYPFIVEKQRKQFARRYPVPAYIVLLHDVQHRTGQIGPEPHLELRIEMVGQCNPLWETRQWLRVLFELPVED